MSCYEARALGFAGKSVIHPSQIPYVRKAFMPTAEELHQYRLSWRHTRSRSRPARERSSSMGKWSTFLSWEKARRIIEEFDYVGNDTTWTDNAPGRKVPSRIAGKPCASFLGAFIDSTQAKHEKTKNGQLRRSSGMTQRQKPNKLVCFVG